MAVSSTLLTLSWPELLWSVRNMVRVCCDLVTSAFNVPTADIPVFPKYKLYIIHLNPFINTTNLHFINIDNIKNEEINVSNFKKGQTTKYVRVAHTRRWIHVKPSTTSMHMCCIFTYKSTCVFFILHSPSSLSQLCVFIQLQRGRTLLLQVQGSHWIMGFKFVHTSLHTED